VSEPREPLELPEGRRARAWTVLSIVAVVSIALDQLCKYLAVRDLSDGSEVRLFGGVIYLDLTRNSGAAFSIGSGFTVIFPLIAMGVVAGILWLSRKLASVPWALAIGLILGGALGNLIDRFFRAPGPLQGHVVDFISAFGPNAEYFPIFNIADSSLFCGVVLAILLEITGRRRDGTRVEKADRSAEQPAPQSTE
jgi:signal peptidase II